MNTEKITEKTGLMTAKMLKAVKNAPKKTADKGKSLKDAFVEGYREGAEDIVIIDEISR